MKLTLLSLAQHLNNQLLPVYWVSSDEPTLVDTACTQIRARAAQNGFTERHVFHIESGFDWTQLASIKNNFSLFSEKQCIEVRVWISRIPQEGIKFFQDLAQTSSNDQCWIITSEKLEAGMLKSTWYQALEKIGGFLALFAPSRHEFPQYLKQQLKAHHIVVTDVAERYLANFLEGNLVATFHVLAQLQTLPKAQPLTPQEVAGLLHDAAQYTVFDLVEAINAKNLTRVLRLLDHLKEQGLEPPLVLWALNREAHSRAQRSRSKEDYQRIINAAEVDLIIKGAAPGKPWLALEAFALSLAGASLQVSLPSI